MTKTILLILATLVFSSNSFAQTVPPEYIVRVIYFVPKGRTPQPDINAKLDRLIKNTQCFFAEQMTAHGFSQKTFEFEADPTGKLVVHRVKGKCNEAYYNSDAWKKVWEEIEKQFHLGHNIWLAALDTSAEIINNYACGLGGGLPLEGRALIPASGGCFNVSLVGHELGHAFGLAHDNRVTGNWIRSADIRDRMITSFCSAEWLDVHRYFKTNLTLAGDLNITTETSALGLTSRFSSAARPDIAHFCGVEVPNLQQSLKVNEAEARDAPCTFEMLDPPSLATPPNAICLRFKVTHTEEMHQVQLHTEEWDPDVAGGFIACKRVSGTSAIVEFVTTELSPKSKCVQLKMIDTSGNFHASDFYHIDVTTMLPAAKTVSIPDTQLAAAVKEKIGNIKTQPLLNLREIDVDNYTGIADLTGLEHAYNLKYLRNLRNGKITDLCPLANLTGLTELELLEHQIGDIRPLENLTNLEVLSIWTNQISDIHPLENLTNLRRLDLGNNRISDITTLQNLAHLEKLYLDNNQISDIRALSNLTNLRTLCLLDNQITDVSPLIDLINLEKLYLKGNPIEDVASLRILLAKNPNLKIDIDIPTGQD